MYCVGRRTTCGHIVVLKGGKGGCMELERGREVDSTSEAMTSNFDF